MAFNFPTAEQIRQQAHKTFLQLGCQPGHEVDKWFQAEYEIMQLPADKIAELTPLKTTSNKISNHDAKDPLPDAG